MQNFTFYYQLKKMMGLNKDGKVDKFIKQGLSESFEPSEISVKNVMAFADAYRHEKTEILGDVDYIIN